MIAPGEGLTGDPWRDLQAPLAELGISENAAVFLSEHGYERIVDLVRMQPGAQTHTIVRQLREVATTTFDAFIADFLRRPLEPYDALTSNVALIADGDEERLRALWDANITTISMLVTVDPSTLGIDVGRWVRGATLLARATRVPGDIGALFNKEFDPDSMYDVITASPRYLLGIGPKFARRLRRIGIETIGTLSQRTSVEIQRELGLSPALADAFIERASAAVGVKRPPAHVDEALADLKAIVERFRVTVSEQDLETYGPEVDILARDTVTMLQEYITFIETTCRMRRWSD